MLFKAGKYYIGDPCYCFSHNKNSWEDLLKETEFFEACEGEYKGKPLYAGSTSYGDGIYYDKKGNKYFVDSGTLGILDVSLIDREGFDFDNHSYYRIIEFKEDFIVDIDYGKFRFGDIYIDTRCEDDD